MLAAHRVPYAATLSLAHREDLLRKVRLARRLRGFRFLVMLSPCPTGWKSEPAEGVDLVGWRWAAACSRFTRSSRAAGSASTRGPMGRPSKTTSRARAASGPTRST